MQNMRKTADLDVPAIFSSAGVQGIKLVAALKILKALALGGAVGWGIERITAPGRQDKKNVQKELRNALINDAANKQLLKFRNEKALQDKKNEDQKTMRLS